MIYDHEGQILEPYSKAPLEVLHNAQITDFSKLVYFELYSIYDQNKQRFDHLFIKDETLAEEFEVTERYIKQAMKVLDDNKLIRRKTSAFDEKLMAKKRKIYLTPLKRNRSQKISYVMFPKSIYRKEDIDSLERVILIELISLLEVMNYEEYTEGEINVSRLADAMGKHRRTILNNLKSLAAKDYIQVAGRGSTRIISLETGMIFEEGL